MGNMDIQINLFTDVADGLRRVMSEAGYDVSSIEIDDHKALIAFAKWNRYLIQPQPRHVFKPCGFDSAGHSAGLEMLEKAIISGDDLTIFMSRNIADITARDGLLDHWGIHHFHLGTQLEPRHRIMKRTGQLLFCRIDDHNAYFIKVAPHGSWYQQELLTILHENWPQSIEFARIKGATGVEHQFNDDEVKSLRDVDSNVLLEVADGAVYMGPGMGTTGDGTNVMDLMYADRIRRTARRIESRIIDNFTEIKNNARLQGRHFGPTIPFALLEAQIGSHWDVIETGTRYRFRVWE